MLPVLLFGPGPEVEIPLKDMYIAMYVGSVFRPSGNHMLTLRGVGVTCSALWARSRGRDTPEGLQQRHTQHGASTI